MSRKILLVEPAFKNKYPPLGLMKLSQYHKGKGDQVEFVKGLSVEHRDRFEWDRVYVSSLFTFDWDKTLDALRYYRYSVKEPYSQNLVLGGVLATLLGDEIRQEVECRVVKGLLDRSGKLGYEDDYVIDSLLPDYSILDQTAYRYASAQSYIGYATRGCIRRCDFCAVRQIEPEFKHYVPLVNMIHEVSQRYGPRRDLVLLDNNVLASDRFDEIIRDIKSAGFEAGARFSYNGKNGQIVRPHRWVDFNQGLDARLLTERKMGLLSEIALRPLRLAFDDVRDADLYKAKTMLAARFGQKYLSNYMLFNFRDRPEDLYRRLRLVAEMNRDLGLTVYSFPMRYIDLRSRSRSSDAPGNLGAGWNKKYLRAIQCVLNATRGIMYPRMDFFEAALGRNVAEFFAILWMPEDYIVNRRQREEDGSTDMWRRDVANLSSSERDAFCAIVGSNKFDPVQWSDQSGRVKAALAHYVSATVQLGLSLVSSEFTEQNSQSAEDQNLALLEASISRTG